MVVQYTYEPASKRKEDEDEWFPEEEPAPKPEQVPKPEPASKPGAAKQLGMTGDGVDGKFFVKPRGR